MDIAIQADSLTRNKTRNRTVHVMLDMTKPFQTLDLHAIFHIINGGQVTLI